MGRGQLRESTAYLSMVSLKLVMHRTACNVILPPNDEPGPPASAGNALRHDHMWRRRLVNLSLNTNQHVMLTVMLRLVGWLVIRLGLYRSLPCYLGSSFGPVRRMLRRASNAGKEEPSLARPHFAGLSRLRYGIIGVSGKVHPPAFAVGKDFSKFYSKLDPLRDLRFSKF